MNKRNRLNLILLLVLGTLLLLALYEPGIEAPTAKPKLNALLPQSITEIAIQHRDRPEILLQKKEDVWHLLRPYKTATNPYRVEALFSLAGAESLGHFSLEGRKPAHYGLDNPSLKVRLNQQWFVFGDREPLNGRRYLQQGDEVHLVEDKIYASFTVKATHFISLKLLPSQEAIERLELPKLSVWQQQGQWQLKPRPANLSMDSVTALMDEWRYAYALSVGPYASPAHAEYRDKIRLQQGGKWTEFLVLSYEPELVLARPDLGLAYTLSGNKADSLLQLQAVKPETPPPAEGN